MKTETIEKIFNFLKEKEGKELPKKWFDLIKKLELFRELENYPDGTQYRHEGYLELSYTNIKKLPNDLYVDGYLNLTYCKQLTKLPKDLYVEGDLFINKTNIQELPDNLYVGDNLWVQGSNIQELPDNLYVGGALSMENTPLAKKYSSEEIRDIVTSKGGTIIKKIYR